MKGFALIGCGKMGEEHATAITTVGKLVAVCDVVTSRADAFATRFKALAYYTIDDLLHANEDIDYVVVCTPNGYHAESIIKSLQARKHVITERPLCITKAAAWQIMETEKFCRRKLFVVQSASYYSAIQQIKKLLLENELGKIYSFHISASLKLSDVYYSEWQCQLFPNGGSLYTPFSNYIEIILFLFGEIDTIKGTATQPGPDTALTFEGGGKVLLQMKVGVEVSFQWCLTEAENYTTIEAIGEKGKKVFTGDGLTTLVATEADALNKKETIKPLNQLPYKQWMESIENKEDDNSLKQAVVVIETIENIYKALSAVTHQQEAQTTGAF